MFDIEKARGIAENRQEYINSWVESEKGKEVQAWAQSEAGPAYFVVSDLFQLKPADWTALRNKLPAFESLDQIEPGRRFGPGKKVLQQFCKAKFQFEHAFNSLLRAGADENTKLYISDVFDLQHRGEFDWQRWHL